PGITVLTNSDAGRSTSWLAASTWRFTFSLGSWTGSAASRGAVAHALTSTGSTHANAHFTHPRARRMPVSPPTGLRDQTRASALQYNQRERGRLAPPRPDRA